MSFKLVGVGELLWDVLPGGRRLGGAPANFAYHARSLGADGRVVSRVGDDPDGRDLLARLRELGLPTEGVEVDPAAPTGTVTVEVAADGQPRYAIPAPVAWDFLAGEPGGRAAVASAGAVCFGTLAQRSDVSRAAIQALLRAAPAAALRILDVNLREADVPRERVEASLALANVLKVSEPELVTLAEMFALPGGERDRVAALATRFKLRLVAYTRGGAGSLLYAAGEWADHPGLPTAVADAVGAGDSFTAALALGTLAGWPLDEVGRHANAVAAFVCSQPGATPPLPDPVRAAFLAIPPSHGVGS